jgi:hypothetical protein
MLPIKMLGLCLSMLFATTLACSLAAEQALSVRLLELLNRPDAFDGKCVVVSGYLHAKFEDHNLYFSKECADYISDEYSIFIDDISGKKEIDFGKPSHNEKLRLESFDCKYVQLTGIFLKSNKKYPIPRIIITALREQERWYDGKKHLKK